jgi:AraC-like DNA-binding protein
MYLTIYFFTITSSLCILFGANYLFRKEGTIINRILAISFLCIGYIITASYFLRPENIIQYPHFYRTVAPVFYLLPVLSYLFVWYILHPKESFKKAHLLLTLPFFLQTLENLKFYLSSVEIKVEEIKRMLEAKDYLFYNPDFLWFDPMIHTYVKIGLYGLFLGIMIFDYLKFKKSACNLAISFYSTFDFWMIGLFIFRIFTFLYMAQNYILEDGATVQLGNPDYFLIAEFLFQMVYISMNPKFLDPLILRNYLLGNLSKNYFLENDLLKEKEEIDSLISIADAVDKYFIDTEVFLNSQLSVELLGSLTGLPHRKISLAIKLKFNLSFRDYLNGYRIEYLENHLINEETLRKLSFELIAESAGFGSRQSFYSAFKKHRKTTPKEYFKSN